MKDSSFCLRVLDRISGRLKEKLYRKVAPGWMAATFKSRSSQSITKELVRVAYQYIIRLDVSRLCVDWLVSNCCQEWLADDCERYLTITIVAHHCSPSLWTSFGCKREVDLEEKQISLLCLACNSTQSKKPQAATWSTAGRFNMRVAPEHCRVSAGEYHPDDFWRSNNEEKPFSLLKW